MPQKSAKGLGRRRTATQAAAGARESEALGPEQCRASAEQQAGPHGVNRGVISRRDFGQPAGSRGWSGRWESNPRYQLGRLKFYH